MEFLDRQEECELAELEAKARLLPLAKDYERTVARRFVAKGGVKGAVSLTLIPDFLG